MKLHKVGALAAVSILAFAACSSGGTASSRAERGRQRCRRRRRPGQACANKKGKSTTEIHVYSSLPRQGTNTAQTNTLVEQIKQTLDGQKIGNFTIKYTDLDDSSAAKNGDWDGAVEQQNANKAANDPDAMVYIGTYNSGAAKLSIPILNARLPGHDQPGQQLPRPDQGRRRCHQPGEPDSYYPGGYRNYARVIDTDDVQGARVAEWAKSRSARRRTSSTTARPTAQGIGRAWALHFGKIGGKVVSAEQDAPKATTRRRLTTARSPRRSRSSGADVVFIGAITGQGTASSGRTSGPRNPTSPDVRPTASTRSPGTRAPAPPATAPSSPSAASNPAS